MSAISEIVRTAIFEKLNVGAVVGAGKATAVYYGQAPENATLPFVVFQRFAPAPPTRAFGQTLIAEDDLWLIKCYADENSSTSKSPQELNQDILQAAETAIGTSLTLSSGETWLVERFADVVLPNEKADLSDRVIFADGFNLRVVATPN